MKRKKLIIWGSIAVVVVIVLVLLFGTNRNRLMLNTTTVQNETVEITVMATGYIQPVEEVEVGTQVSGVIDKIYVDYNSHVKAGDLLAELDKSTLQEKLVQANASLISAQSDLLYAEQNYSRTKKLHDAKAATDVSLEEAVNRLSQAKTSVDNARANANQAKVNLDYAYIFSPIDGVILDRAVNEGQTVAASFNTPTLFTIAEDLTKMQVEVDVDEADIGQIRVGQRAVFTVDAYTDDIFEGTVNQIRLQPVITNNVVTYTVIVEAPNPEEKLFPGMTANITIKVESETGVAVPLEAVNFRITDEIARQLEAAERKRIEETKAQYASAHSTGRMNGNIVWVKKGEEVEPRTIETGINDGIYVIVKSGVNEGEEVVLSASVGKKGSNGDAARNPLMPRRSK